MAKIRRFSDDEKAFLRETVPGRSHKEILACFNAVFKPITLEQVRAFIKNNHLSTGRTGQFPKGHEPYNKGRKGVRTSIPTEFKKGHMPHKYKPVGSERLDKDGYLQVKVADPKTWRHKHLIIWEQANGPLPKGCALVFKDQDRSNIALDNLMLVERKVLLRLNQLHRLSENSDVSEASINLTKLEIAIKERTK